MKHTGSTLVILLFIGLSYFIFPHSFSLLPQKVAAHKIAKVVLGSSTRISPTPTLVSQLRFYGHPSPSPTTSPTAMPSRPSQK